jgi:hypothetical protein
MNEKTNCRLPFPVFKPSRLEVRRMPEVRIGNDAKMRLGAGRARDTGSCCVGAGGDLNGRMPEIIHHGGKHRLGRGVPGTEVAPIRTSN